MSCSSAPAAAGSPNDSPTNAYKRLYNAVKSKNIDLIKAELTQKSLDFAQMVAQRNNSPIEKVLENGFSASTFAESMPQIRDERINENMGAVEVWNAKDSRWEDLPFIKDDNGAWKLAIGELFAGTYQSPGPGRDIREKQAANAAGAGPVQGATPAANANANVQIIKGMPDDMSKEPKANVQKMPMNAPTNAAPSKPAHNAPQPVNKP